MNEIDNSMRPARFRWLVPLILLAGALGLYLLTMSRGVFPGLPAKSLAWHLGLDATPTLLDSLWGRLVHLCAALPGGSEAFWTGVLSAVSGAVCIAVMAALMMRVRYPIHDANDSAETAREGQARVLAGLTAGLFIMLSIPFWILSTRSLPGSFHLLMLLAAAWLFSEYQRTGKPSRLYLLGLLYGAGITEFATFWIFAPLAALLIVRAMLQRAEFSWPVLVRTGLSLIPGLWLYLLNGWTLWADPAVRLRGFGSMWAVIWYMWRDQWHLIVNAPQTTGFLLVMMLTLVPWGMLFLLRAKRPAWRFSAWQVLLRLAVLAAAMAALFNAALSPWNFFGMAYIMATPYLILAACAGYVAGEFWIMGQTREHRNAGIGQPLRKLLGFLGALLPMAVLAAGFLNLPVADGRPGGKVEALAGQVLDDLAGRNVLLADGVLDDSLRLLARRRGMNLLVVTLPQTEAATYRQYLAQFFPAPRQQSLLQVGFGAFLQDFLGSDEGLLRTATLDLTDPLREFGYLVPDHLVFRADPTEERGDLAQRVEAQKPFWDRMEQWAARPLDKRNPACGYQRYLLRLASKVANNIGFMQVERGEDRVALDTFQRARRIDPENISALLNLLTIAQAGELPEAAEYEAEWTAFKERHVDSRVIWSLSALYGYVHNTGFLVRHGMMWAVSGKPRLAEAELRRAAGNQAVNAEVKAFLGQAYLHSGDLQRSAEFYREVLKEKPGDVQALLLLAEMSIGAGDYAAAEKLLAQAEEAGMPPEKLRFERVVLAYLQGQTGATLGELKELVKRDKENIRAWALLAMLTSDGSETETYGKALMALKSLQGSSPDVRLMLAELYMKQKEWAPARTELDEVTRMNPRQIRAWEMLAMVDFYERKRELAEDHVRNLLTLDPENFTGNLMLGSFQYARGQYLLAESSYRAAVKVRRDPAALNDLAYLLMVKGEAGREEARNLVNEALAAQPTNPIFLSTRGELNLREGRYDEAEHDLQRVLAAMPDSSLALLLSAQLYAARGQKTAALELAETLSNRQGELPTEQQAQLQDLLKKMQ
jgi:Tfp pilus assembly protein PilF